MKVICYIIDIIIVCIFKFEFCDIRLEMFYCMIEVIDIYFNKKKNYEFLEWKGILINIFISGLMRRYLIIKIYESVNILDDKCVGFIVICLFYFLNELCFLRILYSYVKFNLLIVYIVYLILLIVFEGRLIEMDV